MGWLFLALLETYIIFIKVDFFTDFLVDNNNLGYDVGLCVVDNGWFFLVFLCVLWQVQFSFSKENIITEQEWVIKVHYHAQPVSTLKNISWTSESNVESFVSLLMGIFFCLLRAFHHLQSPSLVCFTIFISLSGRRWDVWASCVMMHEMHLCIQSEADGNTVLPCGFLNCDSEQTLVYLVMVYKYIL